GDYTSALEEIAYINTLPGAEAIEGAVETYTAFATMLEWAQKEYQAGNMDPDEWMMHWAEMDLRLNDA
ncbi:hypothetical protein ACFL0V_02215, partial [Nanoarchaeota archaeon]